jgi:hypothetical protein
LALEFLGFRLSDVKAGLDAVKSRKKTAALNLPGEPGRGAEDRLPTRRAA